MMGLITYLLKMSLSFTLLYGVYIFLFRKTTFHTVQRIYLLALPLLSVLLPLITLPVRQVVQVNSINLGELIAGAGKPGAEQSFNLLNTGNILTGLYAGGLLFMVARLGVSLAALLLLCRKAVYNRNLDLRIADPAGFKGAGSFFNILFLDKQSVETPNPLIIAHEKVHISQRHWLDILYAEIFRAFNWFNPLAYQYLTSLRLQHEFLADQEICREYPVYEYQSVLLAESFTNPINFEIHSFSKPSYLKLRIMKLNQDVSSKFKLIYYLTVAPVCAVLVFLFMVFSGDPVSATSTANLPALLWSHSGSRSSAINSAREKVSSQEETAPVYPGGDQQLMIDIAKNLQYPAEARKNRTEGRIAVSCIVETDGSVSSVKAFREINNDGFSAAAVTAVKGLKHFSPGTQNGKAVRVSFTVPVTFKLNANASTTGSVNSSGPAKTPALLTATGDKQNQISTGEASSASSQTDTAAHKTPPPLYIVDGKEMSMTDWNVNKLNPDDIYSINVWKGKAAEAKYGDKGKNGVIVVTMKQLIK